MDTSETTCQLLGEKQVVVGSRLLSTAPLLESVHFSVQFGKYLEKIGVVPLPITVSIQEAVLNRDVHQMQLIKN